MSSSKSVKKTSSATPVASAPAPVPAPVPTPAEPVKVTKAKASPTPATPAPASPVPSPVPAPVAEVSGKKKGGKAPVVEATPAVVAPVTEVVAPVVEDADSVSSLLALLQKQTHDIVVMLKNQSTLLNAFFKNVQRERKRLAQQKGAKRQRKVRDGSHKPSGFAVPATISSGLCEFLGVASGTQMSRTDVTRRICAYIKDKKLQNADNKRQFHPDVALGKVLGPLQDKDVSGGYTYFNLQYYINAHFPKSASASASATTSA